MRIFLDIDGVLRRQTSPMSTLDEDCVQCFEEAILIHPDAKIVIASTWRLVHSLEALRRLFSVAIAARIEGVTPDVPDAEEFVRHAEVRAYLNRNKLHGMKWIALDDDPEQYRPDAPLIKVDPDLGFNEDCARRLRAWLAKS
ncbi:MAG: hypothetical protein EXR28_00365 [Betaproteobacteria bacterium]|nr:hypothetical protein [Betaproteobacteria bacterium]